jgi:hypothetical protein
MVEDLVAHGMDVSTDDADNQDLLFSVLHVCTSLTFFAAKKNGSIDDFLVVELAILQNTLYYVWVLLSM